MTRSIARLVSSLVLLTLISIAVPAAHGQEAKPAVKPAAKTAGKGRLPAHYKDVVTNEQKDKIYAIQNSYGDEISKLAEQMKTLTAKRDAEIEALLSADQKKKVDTLKAEAAAKKKPVEATKASAPKPVETTLIKPAAKK